MHFIESEKVELKEIYIPEIKKEVIAFANSFGGVVYIGVADDGTVVGLENVGETMLQLTNALRESIRPDITIFTHAALIKKDGKDIIALTVSEGARKPYYLRDKAEFKDRKEICGSIFTQLNEAYTAIEMHNGTKAQFDKLLRVDHRDYPEQAIREALLNAIVHREYGFSGRTVARYENDKSQCDFKRDGCPKLS